MRGKVLGLGLLVQLLAPSSSIGSTANVDYTLNNANGVCVYQGFTLEVDCTNERVNCVVRNVWDSHGREIGVLPDGICFPRVAHKGGKILSCYEPPVDECNGTRTGYLCC
jgi:hypothetical protein